MHADYIANAPHPARGSRPIGSVSCQIGFLLLALAADTQDSFWQMDLADD